MVNYFLEKIGVKPITITYKDLELSLRDAVLDYVKNINDIILRLGVEYNVHNSRFRGKKVVIYEIAKDLKAIIMIKDENEVKYRLLKYFAKNNYSNIDYLANWCEYAILSGWNKNI